jgi:hypothetical protein
MKEFKGGFDASKFNFDISKLLNPVRVNIPNPQKEIEKIAKTIQRERERKEEEQRQYITEAIKEVTKEPRIVNDYSVTINGDVQNQQNNFHQATGMMNITYQTDIKQELLDVLQAIKDVFEELPEGKKEKAIKDVEQLEQDVKNDLKKPGILKTQWSQIVQTANYWLSQAQTTDFVLNRLPELITIGTDKLSKYIDIIM